MSADPVRDRLVAAGWIVDDRRGPALRWSAWRGDLLILARHDGWIVRAENERARVEVRVTSGGYLPTAATDVAAAWALLTGGVL